MTDPLALPDRLGDVDPEPVRLARVEAEVHTDTVSVAHREEDALAVAHCEAQAVKVPERVVEPLALPDRLGDDEPESVRLVRGEAEAHPDAVSVEHCEADALMDALCDAHAVAEGVGDEERLCDALGDRVRLPGMLAVTLPLAVVERERANEPLALALPLAVRAPDALAPTVVLALELAHAVKLPDSVAHGDADAHTEKDGVEERQRVVVAHSVGRADDDGGRLPLTETDGERDAPALALARPLALAHDVAERLRDGELELEDEGVGAPEAVTGEADAQADPDRVAAPAVGDGRPLALTPALALGDELCIAGVADMDPLLVSSAVGVCEADGHAEDDGEGGVLTLRVPAALCDGDGEGDGHADGDAASDASGAPVGVDAPLTLSSALALAHAPVADALSLADALAMLLREARGEVDGLPSVAEMVALARPDGDKEKLGRGLELAEGDFDSEALCALEAEGERLPVSEALPLSEACGEALVCALGEVERDATDAEDDADPCDDALTEARAEARPLTDFVALTRGDEDSRGDADSESDVAALREADGDTLGERETDDDDDGEPLTRGLCEALSDALPVVLMLCVRDSRDEVDGVALAGSERAGEADTGADAVSLADLLGAALFEALPLAESEAKTADGDARGVGEVDSLGDSVALTEAVRAGDRDTAADREGGRESEATALTDALPDTLGEPLCERLTRAEGETPGVALEAADAEPLGDAFDELLGEPLARGDCEADVLRCGLGLADALAFVENDCCGERDALGEARAESVVEPE